MNLAFEPATASDVGTARANNEDAVFASPRMVAVADGVGGHVGGEVASRLAIDALGALDKRWLEGSLLGALHAATAVGNDTIAFVVDCEPQLAGMATTLTAAAIEGGTLTLASIGDSRAYLMCGGELRRLTRDDSLVQELIDAGTLSEVDARSHPGRSVVLRALDGTQGRSAATATAQVRRGDRVMLCSDGLSDYLDDREIAASLSVGDPDSCAEALVQLALDAGSRDNVSVVVADVVAQADRSTTWRQGGFSAGHAAGSSSDALD